jgi:HEAT repeat protein
MIPMIVPFLDDDDWRVRNGAAVALEDIGDPFAIEPLRQAKRKDFDNFRPARERW